MRRIGIRLTDCLWADVRWYAEGAAIVDAEGAIDISEALRDLISRGLITDHGGEAGYRSGYREGRLAGYSDLMRQLVMEQVRGNRT